MTVAVSCSVEEGGVIHINFVTSARSFAIATKEPDQVELLDVFSFEEGSCCPTVRSSLYLMTVMKACQFPLSNWFLLMEGRRTFSVLPIAVVGDVLAGQIRGCCLPPRCGREC